MADFRKTPKPKKKRPNKLGTPPGLEAAGNNLEAPEHAPAQPEEGTSKKKARAKTGRTKVFSTKVTSDFDKEFRKIAFEDGLKHVELLEAAIESYKREKEK